MDIMIGNNDGTATFASEDGTLADAARSAIRQAIITHALAPGTKVSEQLLVKKFGFTKATTRAAMASLTEEGLIVARSLRMQIVAPLTLADIQNIFHLRNLLEPDAARQAAGRVDEKKLRALNTLCQPRRGLESTADVEFEILEANKAFHLAIAEAAGNPRQYRWISQLHDAVMRVLWFSLRPNQSGGVWDASHDTLIDALTAGDGETAAALALHHLHDGQRAVYERISKLPAFGRREISAD